MCARIDVRAAHSLARLVMSTLGGIKTEITSLIGCHIGVEDGITQKVMKDMVTVEVTVEESDIGPAMETNPTRFLFYYCI